MSARPFLNVYCRDDVRVFSSLHLPTINHISDPTAKTIIFYSIDVQPILDKKPDHTPIIDLETYVLRWETDKNRVSIWKLHKIENWSNQRVYRGTHGLPLLFVQYNILSFLLTVGNI